MATKKKEAPAIIDSVDALVAKIKAMKEAQKVFAAFTQDQVDKIFFEAAMAANKQRIPLAKMAVEETGMGVVEDKVIKNHYAAEYLQRIQKHKDLWCDRRRSGIRNQESGGADRSDRGGHSDDKPDFHSNL